MNNAIIALVLYIVILVGIAMFYVKLGKFSFWKLASKLPDEALAYISSDEAWVIVKNSDLPPGEGFTGPFWLAAPSIGGRVKVYAREDQIEASQQRFIDIYQSQLPPRRFPYLSFLALLYPVAAILSMANTPAPTILILGYGFANLGYLLGLAFIIPGHFRILGMDDRAPTLVAALFFWIIGFVLSNVMT